jgi:hypothetical protein
MSDQFGTIFLSTEFDENVKVFLRRWTDTYLSRIEHQLGLPARKVARPQSWNFLFGPEPEKWPEDKMPAIFVVSFDFDGQPDRLGAGQYGGWWNWNVSAVVSQRDFEATRKVTQMYAAALRTAVVQHPSLDGAVGDTKYLSETLAYPVDARNRTLGMASLDFSSYIECIVEESEGPLEPDAAPPEQYEDWPEVTSVAIDLQEDPLDA